MYFYKLKLYWVHIWFMLLYTNKLRKVIMGVADESTYNSLSKKTTQASSATFTYDGMANEVTGTSY